MTKIVGIRFRTAGKIYYFDPADFDLDMAMHVIVETARGIEMGTVLIPPKDVDDDKVVSPLKPVIRVATDEDEKTVERNKEKEKEAFAICKEKIIKHGLEMKLVDAEYTFDGNKLLFYFTADGRIDFRELVKDLAAVFRTRIELRQIGVRDETKMMGGIGICGRPLCCHSYMADFVPVSIKMAKEQNLSLNPTKISGVCGRLMCCLKYEQDTYEYLNSRMPSVGEKVKTPEGIIGEYTVDDLRLKPRQKKDVKLTEEELRELKDLEDIGDETMEDKPQEKPQRNRGHRDNRDNRENRDSRDNKNEYRERRDKRDNRERRPYRADIEAAEASANETNEVNAANAGRENKDGYKKPYKGGKNRPNKQKYNRNKDYKNKNYNKDYNRDKDNGSTDTQ